MVEQGVAPSPALQTATVTHTVTPSPASTFGGGSNGSGTSNTGPFLLAAALVALLGVFYTQFHQGKLSREANKLTQDSIDATRDIAEQTARRAEADAKRADEAALAQRYQEAATQLGHKSAAVRSAGVYAMARLADDWADQRQECVDVLCA